ncbi:MAG TPA: hypothetical protein VF469_28615 [Kofleriaceae bacterium]
MTDTEDTQTPPDAPAAQDAEATQYSPAAPSTQNVADQPNPLDDLIASIRASVAPGVSPEARAAGATACRAILTALEAQVGQPLAAVPPATASPASQLLSMLPHLAAMPREQLLAFLRDKFPAGTPSSRQPQRVAGPRFHLIQIPQPRRTGGGS